jgi:hypothetical protein
MDFTKGEILIELLRLIASACRSSKPAMSGPESIATAMSRSFYCEISPLVKSISGFPA